MKSSLVSSFSKPASLALLLGGLCAAAPDVRAEAQAIGVSGLDYLSLSSPDGDVFFGPTWNLTVQAGHADSLGGFGSESDGGSALEYFYVESLGDFGAAFGEASSEFMEPYGAALSASTADFMPMTSSANSRVTFSTTFQLLSPDFQTGEANLDIDAYFFSGYDLFTQGAGYSASAFASLKLSIDDDVVFNEQFSGAIGPEDEWNDGVDDSFFDTRLLNFGQEYTLTVELESWSEASAVPEASTWVATGLGLSLLAGSRLLRGRREARAAI